jgi:hypothetical protein
VRKSEKFKFIYSLKRRMAKELDDNEEDEGEEEDTLEAE